jgi:hypothetical protein
MSNLHSLTIFCSSSWLQWATWTVVVLPYPRLCWRKFRYCPLSVQRDRRWCQMHRIGFVDGAFLGNSFRFDTPFKLQRWCGWKRWDRRKWATWRYGSSRNKRHEAQQCYGMRRLPNLYVHTTDYRMSRMEDLVAEAESKLL